MTHAQLLDSRKAALLNFDIVRGFDGLPESLKAATGGMVGKLLDRLRSLDEFAGAAAGCVLRLNLLGKPDNLPEWFTGDDAEDAMSEYNALCLYMREVQAGNAGEDGKVWQGIAPAISEMALYGFAGQA